MILARIDAISHLNGSIVSNSESATDRVVRELHEQDRLLKVSRGDEVFRGTAAKTDVFSRNTTAADALRELRDRNRVLNDAGADRSHQDIVGIAAASLAQADPVRAMRKRLEAARQPEEARGALRDIPRKTRLPLRPADTTESQDIKRGRQYRRLRAAAPERPT